ncbi:hypothetical protein JHU38_02470 [Prevotella sp. A2931]|jgi:hypothetical protein|uniref:DUF4398 domain-containing protein n=1 Tax=Prevotella illustrans TaxID=2800387 RepID=A0ABS3M3A2_9BACT|nr:MULTISPECIES: hypothetical protein [Prevotella]MBO1362653.1 hypothetical protein [Prevotella illustrans]PTL25177.1 hypothetical protein C3V39_10785 [Prevotella sp. oral taxon 820]
MKRNILILLSVLTFTGTALAQDDKVVNYRTMAREQLDLRVQNLQDELREATSQSKKAKEIYKDAQKSFQQAKKAYQEAKTLEKQKKQALKEAQKAIKYRAKLKALGN